MLGHAYLGQVGGVTAWSDAEWMNSKDAECFRIQMQELDNAVACIELLLWCCKCAVVFQRLVR